MRYGNCTHEQTKAGEIMNGLKPLINPHAPKPRRSNMVAMYRLFAVVVCISGVCAVVEAYGRLHA